MNDGKYFGLTPSQLNLAFLAVVGAVAFAGFVYFGGVGAVKEYLSDEPAPGPAAAVQATPEPAFPASPPVTIEDVLDDGTELNEFISDGVRSGATERQMTCLWNLLLARFTLSEVKEINRLETDTPVFWAADVLRAHGDDPTICSESAQATFDSPTTMVRDSQPTQTPEPQITGVPPMADCVFLAPGWITLPIHATMNCGLNPNEAASSISWTASGFVPSSSAERVAHFASETPGPASISVNWTDSLGDARSLTFHYKIAVAACIPDDGSTITIGDDTPIPGFLGTPSVQALCSFGLPSGATGLNWMADGLATLDPGDCGLNMCVSFTAETPGPGSITANWTDSDGQHSQTVHYTIKEP